MKNEETSVERNSQQDENRSENRQQDIRSGSEKMDKSNMNTQEMLFQMATTVIVSRFDEKYKEGVEKLCQGLIQVYEAYNSENSRRSGSRSGSGSK